MKMPSGPLDLSYRAPGSQAFVPEPGAGPVGRGRADPALRAAEAPLDLFPEPVPAPSTDASPAHSLAAWVSEWNHQRLARRRALRARRPQVQQRAYATWIEKYDSFTPTIVQSFKLRERHLEWRPLISILVPVFNPDAEQLAAAVRSVQSQIYGHWELCIADDASTTLDTRPWLLALARRDARIKLVFRAANGHISAASNSALALASGEFVALLDQDDLLRPHSLLMVVEALNACPDAALLYSDEDKIGDDGRRTGHYFKCDWNPYLFRSHNLVSHLGVYRRDVVQRVGGFRSGLEGAQDYDLALRCCEQLSSRQIVHLPFVLYHWRVHGKSTAKGLNVKPYAARAAERALQEHLDRMGIAGRAEAIRFGYRVRYEPPRDAPRVSIVIPTRNKVRLLRTCVNSIIEKTDYPTYDILIVDNGSTDAETLRYLRYAATHERVRVIRDDRPFNYAQLNNDAVAHCTAEFVCLLNNDIEIITPDWLTEMMSLAQFSDVGAVGAKLLYADGSVQHAGVIVGIGGVAAHAHKNFGRGDPGYLGRAGLIQELSAVTAACMLVRREAYREVGGLDERHLAVAFNDVDLCLKLKARGYRNVWTPYAVLYHHESVSRGADDDPKKAARFQREADYIRHRWERVIRHDPAYSPNLTLEHENFGLAFPPRVSMADAYWFDELRAAEAG